MRQRTDRYGRAYVLLITKAIKRRHCDIGAVQESEGKGSMKLLAALLMTLPLYVACEPKGPLQQAGQEVDQAIEDARNGGETLGNKIGDAADDVREGVENAVDELNDK